MERRGRASFPDAYKGEMLMSKAMKSILRVYDTLEAHVLSYSLAFTTILIFIQVVLRYVFNHSLSWSEELARYIFIWQIWLGTSVAMKEGGHINLDLLKNKLSGRGRIMLELLANILMVAFCAFLVIKGWDLASSMMRRGLRSPAMRIPTWIIYSSLPFSQLIVAIRLIGKIRENLLKLFGRAGIEEPEAGKESA